MKIYELHSDAFGCKVRLSYNDSGILMNYEVMIPDVEQVASKAVKLFITEDHFKETVAQLGLKCTEIDRVITFEMFWKRYAYTPDKKLAMDEWAKLSKAEQLLAYDFIPRYDTQLKQSGFNRKYAVRFLKNKPWIQ